MTGNGKGGFYHSLTINREVCVGCTHCITKCPTRALRIRDGKAVIHENWCIDCGECKKVCPVGAIYVEQNDLGRIFDYPVRVALVPAIFLGQFPETTTEEEIFDAIYALGFTHISQVELTAELVREETVKQIAVSEEKPSISPYCPAVVRLIQVKFPDLVDNIMSVKTPVEATATLLQEHLLREGYPAGDIGMFYITPCAAKIAAIQGNEFYSSLINGVLNMDFVYNKVCHALQNKPPEGLNTEGRKPPMLNCREMSWSLTSGEADNFEGRCFAVDEIHNVIEFIERTSMTGEIHNIDFLELRACDRGCVGGVLTPTNRFLAAERLHKRSLSHPEQTNLHREVAPETVCYVRDNIEVPRFMPMAKLKYEGDINEVLEKMKHANRIMEILPGIDCGACGSPGCKTLAEDIVRGEARFDNCIFMQREMEKSGEMSSEQSRTILEKVWGKQRAKKSNYKNET